MNDAVARSRTVSLVVPARNEASTLAAVLARVPGGAVDEIVVVVGPSADATLAVAHGIRPPVHVVRHDGPDEGGALRAGFAAARGDVLVTLDADGTTDPALIPAVLAALDTGLDVASTGRLPAGTRRLPARLARRRPDAGRGLLAFARVHLSRLDLDAGGPALLASATRAGLTVGGPGSGSRRSVPRRPLWTMGHPADHG